MRPFLLLLVLVVVAWFAYSSLVGGDTRAASREPGLHGFEGIAHEIPSSPSVREQSAPRPAGARSPEPRSVELETSLASGDPQRAAALALSLAGTQAGDRRFRDLTAKTVQELLAAGDPEGAAAVTSASLDHWTMGALPWPESASEWEEWQALLRRVTNNLVFNPGVAWRSRTYRVQRHDNLTKVCQAFLKSDGARIEPGFLAAVNRFALERPIHPEQALRVPLGQMRVVVEKRSFTLKLFLDEVLIRVYRVGLGKDGRTPSASFTVSHKLINPVWFRPGKPPVPHGHPDNPLGDHYLGLESDLHQGFAIHGTSEQDRPTIGTFASEGCVRMYAEDVAELFSFLPRGAKVLIR